MLIFLEISSHSPLFCPHSWKLTFPIITSLSHLSPGIYTTYNNCANLLIDVQIYLFYLFFSPEHCHSAFYLDQILTWSLVHSSLWLFVFTHYHNVI